MPDLLEGLFAIIPTPAKPSTPDVLVTETVDLDETERLVKSLLADGVGGFIILGTSGECATLTRADYERYADCVISTVGQRVPVFAGTTSLGLHETIDRIKFVKELGAFGTLLGLPMWQPLTLEMAVGFYARVSETFPEFPVMAYANKRAFRFAFDVDFWRQVTDRAPTVTSAKHSKPDTLLEFIDASRGRIQFVPHQTAVYPFAQLAPEQTQACWSIAACLGPEPALAIIDSIRKQDWDRATKVWTDIKFASQPMGQLTADPELFASYTIQAEKTRLSAGNYCVPGPIRPPYDVVLPEIVAAAKESAKRWTALRPRYAVG